MTSLQISINDENQHVIDDLLTIYYSDTYINIKGYLQKLVENLWKLGYYKDNESLFPKGLK